MRAMWMSLLVLAVCGCDDPTRTARKGPDASSPIVNSIDMVLVPISAGEFLMGNSTNGAHRVTLTKSFHLGQTEVTQGQWKAVMDTTPWKGKPGVKEGDDYAATYVSWEDAVAFCEKLSEKEGVKYRLPTEAEWEYACRADEPLCQWSFGDDESQLGEYAWYSENSKDGRTRYSHIVGQKKPNSWDLYDMHGNVMEWCQDEFGEYPTGAVTDPTGPAQSSGRVLRGGSFDDLAAVLRSVVRINSQPSARSNNVGFRAARTAP